VDRARRRVVFLDGEPAHVDAIDDVADERADQLHGRARLLVLGDHGERRAPHLAPVDEREQVTDGPVAVERDEARVIEDLGAQAQVMRAQHGLAHRAEHVGFECGERGEVIRRQLADCKAAHWGLPSRSP
jgi:hypothetical protein